MEHMKKDETRKRIEKLKDVINHYRYLYHVLDKQEISDEALDSLKHELLKLEKAYPEFITPDSPTQRIGGKPLEKFKKIKHRVKQWSLEDAFSQEEIQEWEKRLERFLGLREKVDFVGELKIDGLHVVLTYEKGILISAATRGDGQVGEDVTQNLKTIEAIPLGLTRPVSCVVEGEVFMKKSVFDRLNKERKKKGEVLLANPRNAAAGAVRQLDPTVVAKRKLDVFVYDLVWPEANIPATQQKELELLAELGFKVNKHWKHLKVISDAIAFWEYWERKKDSQDYWVDGIVLKVSNRSKQEKLGFTGKAPRWSLAVKFSPEEKTTVVEKITPFVGRTGKITPVATVKPVVIKGTTVSRATLHNYDEIERLDVRIGDTVIITKAGDIIPRIIKVIARLRPKVSKPVTRPPACPICKSNVVQRRGEVGIFCTNKQCTTLRARKLSYFVSRQGLDIEGFGSKIVERLMDEGLVERALDIFDLQVSDIKDLEGFGEKSAHNLISSISKAKHVPLWRFLNALGIDYIGKETVLLIRDWLQGTFGTIENPKKLLSVWKGISAQNLREIHGIGPKAAESFTQFVREKPNQLLLEGLTKRNMMFVEPLASEHMPLKGMSFVFTGHLSSMSREKAQKHVFEQGGKASDSLSHTISYLVTGQSPGSKVGKAKKLGVKIISEKTFLAMIT
jgi:DNA ligase (NAD+)